MNYKYKKSSSTLPLFQILGIKLWPHININNLHLLTIDALIYFISFLQLFYSKLLYHTNSFIFKNKSLYHKGTMSLYPLYIREFIISKKETATVKINIINMFEHRINAFHKVLRLSPS